MVRMEDSAGSNEHPTELGKALVTVYRCPFCLGSLLGIHVDEYRSPVGIRYRATMECACGAQVWGDKQDTVDKAIESMHSERVATSISNYGIISYGPLGEIHGEPVRRNNESI